MAAKLCNVTFYKRGAGVGHHHTYLLAASTLADGETVAGTIAPITDSPRPERLTTTFESGDVDRVLAELVGMVEELGDFADWSKLSDCP